jgi:hypothetical protein
VRGIVNQWNIDLSPWIISDGNYRHFSRGQVAHFAVELFVQSLERSARPEKQADHLEGSRYRVSAEIVYLSDRAAVVDFGLQAYWDRHGEPDTRIPEGATVGSFVCGEIGLGIDPYPYFEQPYKLPGIPALIYTWHIDAITMNWAPYIHGADPTGRPCWVADESKIVREAVERTDGPTPVRYIPGEWHDTPLGPMRPIHSTHWVSCTLHCTRLPAEPTHRRDRV